MAVIKLNPFPWIVPDAIPYLESLISDVSSEIVETGSGGSTLWFAERCAKLISFEHNKRFYTVVKKEVALHSHVKVIYSPEYPKTGLPKFDFIPGLVFIDGRGRVKSILSAWPQIAKGGYLVLDNANRPKYRAALKLLDKEAKSIAIFRYNYKKNNQWTTAFYKK